MTWKLARGPPKDCVRWQQHRSVHLRMARLAMAAAFVEASRVLRLRVNQYPAFAWRHSRQRKLRWIPKARAHQLGVTVWQVKSSRTPLANGQMKLSLGRPTSRRCSIGSHLVMAAIQNSIPKMRRKTLWLGGLPRSGTCTNTPVACRAGKSKNWNLFRNGAGSHMSDKRKGLIFLKISQQCTIKSAG